MLQNKVHKKG
jgi:hypothetical protein